MSNKSNTLFVFEGEDDCYIGSKLEHFVGESIAIKCAYCGDIYKFYRQLKKEEFDTDILTLLKHCNEKNCKILDGYDNDSFAYIYFFFDYDGQATGADDGQIAEMIDYFNNETENGKLFVSYPMLEAIRHYKSKDSFKELTVKCKRNNCPNIKVCALVESCLSEPRYKAFVPKDSNLTITNLSKKENWKELIDAHLCKANYLVHDDYSRPHNILYQSDIFKNQLQKHICKHCPEVAVLSAFPLFVLDYYGVGGLNGKLDK